LHIEEIFFNFSHEQYGVSTLIRPCRGFVTDKPKQAKPVLSCQMKGLTS